LLYSKIELLLLYRLCEELLSSKKRKGCLVRGFQVGLGIFNGAVFLFWLVCNTRWGCKKGKGKQGGIYMFDAVALLEIAVVFGNLS